MNNIIADDPRGRQVPPSLATPTHSDCPAWCQAVHTRTDDHHFAIIGEVEDIEGVATVDISEGDGREGVDRSVAIDSRVYSLDDARTIRELLDKAIRLLEPPASPWIEDPATVVYEQRGECVHPSDQGIAYELQIDTWTNSPAAPTVSYSELGVQLGEFKHDRGESPLPEIDVVEDGTPVLTVTAPDARRFAAALTRAAALVEGVK